MSQAPVVKITPPPRAKIEELVALLYDAWNLDAVIDETQKVQHIAQRVSAKNRTPAEAEQVAAMHASQAGTVETAKVLLQQVQDKMGAFVAEYLSQQGIVKGMTLFDSQGLPFIVQRTFLVLDWQRDDAVQILLKDADSDVPRVSIYLSQGALIRVAE